MKIQIRRGVFETNSSSTHSLVMFKGSDWELFKEGKMLMSGPPYFDKLVKVEDVPKEDVENEDYITYDTWSNMDAYADDWEALKDVVKDSNGVDSTVVISIYCYN